MELVRITVLIFTILVALLSEATYLMCIAARRHQLVAESIDLLLRYAVQGGRLTAVGSVMYIALAFMGGSTCGG